MITKNQIKQTLINNTVLLNDYKIKKAGLFGSYAKGLQTENSDIDLLVDFSETIDIFKYTHLIDDIIRLFGIHVDIVTPGSIKPAIKENILNEVEWIRDYLENN